MGKPCAKGKEGIKSRTRAPRGSFIGNPARARRPGAVLALGAPCASQGMKAGPELICPAGSVSTWGCTYRRTPWGTWPAKAGSTVSIPSERILSTIRYWEREEEREQGAGEPQPPRDGPGAVPEPGEEDGGPEAPRCGCAGPGPGLARCRRYLQVALFEVPGGRQRPCPSMEVPHAVPGQECRPREVRVDLRLVQTQRAVNLCGQQRLSRPHGCPTAAPRPCPALGYSTRCQVASCPTKASARLMPLSAIQSISRSQRAQSHHAKE